MQQKKWIRKWMIRPYSFRTSYYNLWSNNCRIIGKTNPKLYSRKRMYQAKNKLLVLRLLKKARFIEYVY